MASMMFEVTWLNYIQRELMIQRTKYIADTMARGNCSSMNNEIAGNMMSEVRGFDDTAAAVAKELKATSRGIPLQSDVLSAFPILNAIRKGKRNKPSKM